MERHNLNTSLTTSGRLEPRDGNNGATVAPANLCPEASSINLRSKSPGGSGLPLTQALLNQLEGQLTRDSMLGQIPRGSILCNQRDKETTLENTSETSETIDLEVTRRHAILREEETLKKNLGKRQAINIATLNIRGRNDRFHKSKFKDITTYIRRERIAILAIQETKMKPEEEINVMNANPRIHYINNSIGDEQQGAGIGFVLNKDLIQNKRWHHTTIIPGRASRLEIEWTEEQGLDIINIYAPNDGIEKRNFLIELYKKLNEIEDWNEPIIMGDFNFVEDAIDRYPKRKDNEPITNEWNKIQKKFNLLDGWRIHNNYDLEYTYTQKTTGSMSRIDRVYTTRKMITSTFDWIIDETGIQTDHKIVKLRILKANMPYMGSGLVKIYQDTIEYAPFRKRVKKELMKTQEQMKQYYKTKRGNTPQGIWSQCKKTIKEIAKEEKEKRADLKKQKGQHYGRKAHLAERHYIRTNEKVKDYLKEKEAQKNWENTRIKEAQKNAEARYNVEGEKMTKYWFKINKPITEQTIIRGLKNEKGQIKTETSEMVEIAVEHHKKLQKKPERKEEDEQAIKGMLDQIETKLTKNESDEMTKGITKDEVRESLKKSENGKAPGKDGLPYEFYKSWKEPENEQEREIEPDILQILTNVYNDIETRGLQGNSFNEGAMCLLFKKKDRTKIENYRPITLTNTDYKLLTKTIATRLGRVAENIIHTDQAGFIPGRGLYDNTKLTQVMIDYCEQEEINGCIISLDQEKAYDKIAHDYLWRVLERFKFPQNFIKLIQNLYKNATTTIVLNQVASKRVKIERGVRQGCPMSCILYNIAIEPLACAIRNSNLKGVEVEGLTKRIIVSLFADDTLIYMNEQDDMNEVKEIIEVFCKASTAKFNLEKTEYLPVGKPEYREKVETTRRINNKPGNKIPNNITIIKEGQTMRTLGSWVGNGGNQNPQWNSIIKKQQDILEKWGKMRPSYRGKELILKALVQSRALFLATVNGMPKETEKKMQKEMKLFLWNGKRGKVSWKEATRRRTEGGLGMPDMKARNEAIQIIWLQKYLTPGNKRPRWAFIVDRILAKNAVKKPIVDENSKISWIMQTWHESEASWSKIPNEIKEMLKVARKYNAGIDVINVSLKTKKEMPIWHHIAATDNYGWNKKAARTLRNNHKVKTVGDITNIINTPNNNWGCVNHHKCIDMANTLLGKVTAKFNPNKENPNKDNLDHTPRRKNKNMKGKITEEELTFNPEVTAQKDPLEEVRILGPKTKYKKRGSKDTRLYRTPAYRKKQSNNIEEITLYTDGTSTRNGSENSIGGAGIWHKENSELNRTIRIPGKGITNQKAEIIAIMEAVKKETKKKMTIISDSKTVLEGIIKHHKKWEDHDWLYIENRKEWEELIYRLRIRRAETTFKWVKGHNGNIGNEKADELADEGALEENEDIIEYKKKEKFTIRGARLQSLKQSTAYHLIIRKKNEGIESNKTKKSNLEDSKDEIERVTKYRPNDKQIWKGIYSNHIRNKIGDLIWTMLQGRVRCGRYFEHITDMKENQYCKCGEIESIDHILLECQENQVNEVWKTAEETWKKTAPRNKTWTKPTPGILKGIGAFKAPTENEEMEENRENMNNPKNDKRSGSIRYQLIVSEAIWLIWTKRNKRIFENEVIDKKRITEEWVSTLKKRIEIDFTKIKQVEYKKRNKKIEEFRKLWCNHTNSIEIKEDKKKKLHLVTNF